MVVLCCVYSNFLYYTFRIIIYIYTEMRLYLIIKLTKLLLHYKIFLICGWLHLYVLQNVQHRFLDPIFLFFSWKYEKMKKTKWKKSKTEH